MRKMFISKKLFIIDLIFVAVVSVIVGITCSLIGRSNSRKAVAPFSTLAWKSSYDDMVSVEGNNFSTYDSIYGGLCYSYPKAFNGRNGTVKYMFDDKGSIKSISWAYNCDNAEEITTLYEEIKTDVNEKYGDSGYSPVGNSNFGAVWYLKSGNIVLSAMSTGEAYALQYGYLHPDVSHVQDN